MEEKKRSFVFYETFYDQLMVLKQEQPELANELLWAICEYGLTGHYTETSIYAKALMVGFIAAIDRAKDRYRESVENGKKGGRPSIWIDKDEARQRYSEMGTWKAVAKSYNVNEDTLRRLRRIWDAQDSEEAEKPKNPNDNVNDNVNDNDNINVNENNNVISLSLEGERHQLYKAVVDNNTGEVLKIGVDEDALARATTSEERIVALGL